MIDRYKLTICLALSLLSMAWAPAAHAADLSLEKSVKLAGPVDLNQEPATAVDGDRAWALFYGEGRVHNHLQTISLDKPGEPQTVYRLAPGPNRLDGLGFAAGDGHRYMLWRAKFGTAKDLYFSRSEDGSTFSKQQVLNRKRMVLPPLSLGVGSSGLIVAAWFDERRRGHHDAYAAISHDGGKTFGEDIRASKNYDDASAPILRVRGASIRLFFVGRKGATVWLIHRWSMDAGRTWREVQVEATHSGVGIHQITPLQTSWQAPGASSPRLLLFWAEGKSGMKEAYSDDGGKTWQTAGFPDPGKGEFVLSIDISTAGSRIYMVDGLTVPGNHDLKPDSFVHVSDDGGQHWDKRKRISSEPYHMTMNINPRIAADPDGKVLIVWQDFRNIRSNLYLKASTDGGRTWTKDTLLEESGKFSSISPLIVGRAPGVYNILFLRLANDMQESGALWKKRVELK